MHHCVAIHAADIAEGWKYVYRVLDPVRATLAIVNVGPHWVLREMSGVCNAGIPLELQKRLAEQLLATTPGDVAEVEDTLPVWDRSDKEELSPWVEEEVSTVIWDEDPKPGAPPWDRRENAARVAALAPEDLQIYRKCLAVLG